jgi:hypothetical protein
MQRLGRRPDGTMQRLGRRPGGTMQRFGRVVVMVDTLLPYSPIYTIYTVYIYNNFWHSGR